MEYTLEEKEAIFEQGRAETYVSEHYVLHFQSGSLAENDSEWIAQNQERCFSQICAVLQIDYQEKIHYYFSESPMEIGRVFWEEGTHCNGVALCGREQAKIYAVYNETVKCIGAHEDTHLISFLLNYPESDFVVEGLAMFMDGLWWGVTNDQWAAYFKQKRPEISVLKLLDNDIFAKEGCVITYPIAGAFTAYLIDTYGIEKYLNLYKYKEDEYEGIFVSIFKSSVSEIEENFWQKIRKIDFDPIALEEMLKAEGI